MCGIAGAINLISEQDAFPENKLKKMGDALQHRGPDSENYFHGDGVSLVHRRLSIIDLSGGNQPIFNENKSVCVILNGEIYNYREIRLQLERQGHSFSTQTDTEVLVHLYEQHGPNFLPLLNGMFAFALYDIEQQTLLLARDRFGVKPLFYTKNQGRLLFSSELRSLLCGMDSTPAINPQALSNYLMLSFIPEPHSIYQGILRLPAGWAIHIGLGIERVWKFADIHFGSKIKITRQEAEEETLRLFRQAVERQLVADVPVSTLLSSGLDSRAILTAMVKGGNATTAFTLGYAEKEFDETAGATFWAKGYGVDHRNLSFSEADFLGLVDARTTAYSEPFGFLCDVGFVHLAKAVRQGGFKVTLSGAGGDELFAGYPTLNAAMAMKAYRYLPRWATQILIKAGIAALPAGNGRLPLRFQLESFNSAQNRDLVRAFLLFKQVVSPAQAQRLFKSGPLESMVLPDPIEVYTQFQETTAEWHTIDALSYLDLKVFLSGNVLFSGDHEFMSAGVEQRFPFLDNDLAAFAATLPVEIRFSMFSLKQILKNALATWTQIDGISMPKYKKMGFEIPVQTWMRKGAFAEKIDQTLLKNPFLNRDFCGALLKEERSGKNNHDRKIQNIYALGRFLTEVRGQ